MSVEEIYNYRRVNDRISTSGQPTEDQLRAVKTAGFQTVINLATNDPRYSLANEASLVRVLGMTYRHIPVEWENPQASDFVAFEAAMEEQTGNKVLIHCAANFRVSAFYSLYALKHLGWTEAQADEFRAPIWSGNAYPIWDKFIGEMTAKIRQPE